VLARVLSSILNYLLNRKAVFRSKASVGRTFVRYVILAAVVMLVSAGAVSGISALLGLESEGDALLKTVIKAGVDCILFLVNFRIQREWVFADKETKRKETK
jgi:putative flippase GtrA